jgi:hypothetical protein
MQTVADTIKKALETKADEQVYVDGIGGKTTKKPDTKWRSLDWVKEFPGMAPKTTESKPKNVEKKFAEKQKEQSVQTPQKPGGGMPVATAEPEHYVDLTKYGNSDFYIDEYPGLGGFAKAEEITHYDGLYQDEATKQTKPKNVPKKFKYKLGERKNYTNQYRVLIEAPMKLYKDFMVAKAVVTV